MKKREEKERIGKESEGKGRKERKGRKGKGRKERSIITRGSAFNK